MWEEIDTALPDAAQQSRVHAMRQAIRTHAARTDGTNYISRHKNAAITLGVHTPYTSQRGVTTPANNHNLPQPLAASASQTAPPPQLPSTTRPLSQSSGAPIQPATPPSQLNATRAAHPRTLPDDPYPLNMLHRKEVHRKLGLGKTYYYDATKGIGPIPYTCALYRYGGPVVKAYCRGLGAFDIMLCDPEACSYCSSPEIHGIDDNRRAAEAAERSAQLDVSKSPYRAEGDDRGRPFVHAGRDAPERYGRREFVPEGEGTTPTMEVVAGDVVMDDRVYDPGNKGTPGARVARQAVLCNAETCEVCKK